MRSDGVPCLYMHEMCDRCKRASWSLSWHFFGGEFTFVRLQCSSYDKPLHRLTTSWMKVRTVWVSVYTKRTRRHLCNRSVFNIRAKVWACTSMYVNTIFTPIINMHSRFVWRCAWQNNNCHYISTSRFMCFVHWRGVENRELCYSYYSHELENIIENDNHDVIL